MNNTQLDISLETLNNIEHLSVRTINICKITGLTSLKLILDYYLQNGTFKTIRKCGSYTDKELTDICKKYKGFNLPEEVTKANILEKINALSPFQKAILNRHIDFLTSSLSTRSFNGLNTIIRTHEAKNVFETIFCKGFSFNKITNIGKKSFEELELFKSKIIDFVYDLQMIEVEQLCKEHVKLVVKTTFKQVDKTFEKQLDFLFDENGKIKIFGLLKLLVEADFFFSAIEKRIFTSSYSKQDSETLDLIAREVGLTRERVRQIKLKLAQNFSVDFLFVSNFMLDDLVNYGIDRQKDYILIDEIFVKKVNFGENVKFNALFYCKVFELFLKTTHQVLGDRDLIIKDRLTQNKRKWKNCYLINSVFFESFNFNDFVENFHFKLSDRIIETYSLNFKGYIYEFLDHTCTAFLDEIQTICESLIFHEFELVISDDGYLNFEKNTKRQVHEYAFEILDFESKPLTITEINSRIKEKFIDVNTPESSLRGCLNREKEIFIYFGRSSTYGLRKWEIEQKDIKGGTIRDIIESYLINEDEPKHISEILNVVLPYRPETSEKSIMSNIKLEDNNKFRFFSGVFVGLNSKKYNGQISNFKKLQGSHFRRAVLKKMNGWNIDQITNHFVDKFNYKSIQVKFIIQKKIDEGIIQVSDENNLII